MALRQVLDRVVELLKGRGLGAKQISADVAQALRQRGGENRWFCSEVSRQAVGLFNLLRHTLENVECDDGFKRDLFVSDFGGEIGR